MIRLALMYASETWTLSESDIGLSRLSIFERKILRKIYGPVKEGKVWRIRNTVAYAEFCQVGEGHY